MFGCTCSLKKILAEKESGWIWNGITGKFDLILLTEAGKVRFSETGSQPENE